MQISSYTTASTLDAPQPGRRLVKSIHIYIHRRGQALSRAHGET